MCKPMNLKFFLQIHKFTGLLGHPSPTNVKENMHVAGSRAIRKEDQLLCSSQVVLLSRALDLAFASRAMELRVDPL